ncbi:MAG: peptidoglycan editing factor PgeF [Helicobacteraceae bacterium]|nr:peptidoglycan editing factor PgeF [Helicobacteraceae bacterium]
MQEGIHLPHFTHSVANALKSKSVFIITRILQQRVKIRQKGSRVFQFQIFAGFKDIRHTVTDCGDGDMRDQANRDSVSKRLEIDRLVVAKQVHGSDVVLIDTAPREPKVCDAMIADKADLPLTILTADCVPILLFDPKTRSIGVAHAGWRGSAAMIAVKTVRAMTKRFGAKPDDLIAGIGPSICDGCYHVGDEVITTWGKLDKEFRPALKSRRGAESKTRLQRRQKTSKEYFLHLQLANRLMLRSVGVNEKNIETISFCTYETTSLFSYRRDSGCGRFASVIALV